ncbi:ABC transporter permease [Catenulispora acidiphila]|uniref:ABC transporter permease n=1 Tax=Catenulispora acidiphila TaxID=304895 RepID=UPI00019DEA31|nr:ABC transporter permease [Catenulispora acidiphila]
MSVPVLENPGVAGARARTESEPVSLRRAIASEWIKFRTLRSTWAVLGVAMVAMVAIGLIVAYNTRHLTSNLQANDIAPSSTLQGYYLGQLLIGALGVLFVSGEYSTGMIRATLAAVPRRIPVIWAKLAVFVGVVATSMIVMSFVAFLAAQGLLSHYRPGYSLSDPGVLRVVLGTGVYLTLIGVVGGILAWIVRSTPGALTAFVGVVLVVPVLFEDTLGNWGKNVGKFLPGSAGGAFASSLPEGYALTPAWGFVVLLGWVVLGLAASAILLRRRDA